MSLLFSKMFYSQASFVKFRFFIFCLQPKSSEKTFLRAKTAVVVVFLTFET